MFFHVLGRLSVKIFKSARSTHFIISDVFPFSSLDRIDVIYNEVFNRIYRYDELVDTRIRVIPVLPSSFKYICDLLTQEIIKKNLFSWSGIKFNTVIQYPLKNISNFMNSMKRLGKVSGSI